jgi:hypothetical protein
MNIPIKLLRYGVLAFILYLNKWQISTGFLIIAMITISIFVVLIEPFIKRKSNMNF